MQSALLATLIVLLRVKKHTLSILISSSRLASLAAETGWTRTGSHQYRALICARKTSGECFVGEEMPTVQTITVDDYWDYYSLSKYAM
jgi:hypothetical protein